MDSSGDIVQLVALAAALHDIASDDRYHGFSDLWLLVDKPRKDLDSLGAAALDALAGLAPYAPDQRFALAATLGHLGHIGHIELYIAGDTEEVPTAVVHHLTDICTRLLSIRALIEASPNCTALLRQIDKNPHVNPGHHTNPGSPPEPAYVALHALELDLYKYSRNRIRAQIANARPFKWIDELSHLVACIKGAPANTRKDLSKGERDALGKLQRSAPVQECLPRLDSTIAYLRQLIKAAPDDDLDYQRLRRVLITLVLDERLLKKDFPQFDRFFSAHVAHKTGKIPHPAPRTSKWLKNVFYVTRAFFHCTRILTVPAISAMFGPCVAIHPITNIPPPKRTYTAVPTASAIEATLAAAVVFGATKSTFLSAHPEKFDDLVARLAAAAGRHAPATHMHCECALLCHLWDHYQPTLPYIGLPEAPCMFCDLFFAAYRDHRGDRLKSGMMTRETEGEAATAAWMYPDFPHLPDSPAIQKSFRGMLCSEIYMRVLSERSRIESELSKAAQSTSASNVERSTM